MCNQTAGLNCFVRTPFSLPVLLLVLTFTLPSCLLFLFCCIFPQLVSFSNLLAPFSQLPFPATLAARDSRSLSYFYTLLCVFVFDLFAAAYLVLPKNVWPRFDGSYACEPSGPPQRSALRSVMTPECVARPLNRLWSIASESV